ncbi:hypothetical protein GPALN_009692 [Globodera pallida]|nr:hypothetical protein GPALN_009692 [Globodera pallida]
MSSSSSSSSNPADWTPVSPCGCGCQNYCAPLQETLHHAVLVYFVCGKCANENRCTYELTHDVGKQSRWGYYGRTYGIIAETKLNVSYEEIEDVVFRGMWSA